MGKMVGVIQSNNRTTRLIHVGCGGDVEEDWSKIYLYDSNEDDDSGTPYPAYRCDKCGEEIVGDQQVETVEDYNEQ